MGEHRTNSIAIANSKPRQAVPSIDLGENYRLLGVGLEPMFNKEGDLCVVVTATGGRHSDLMPMQPVSIILTELGKIPLATLRQDIADALKARTAGVDG